MVESSESIPKQRNSNLELFRIIVMLLIVAHHYVVNSGLTPVMAANYPSGKSVFLYLFGWAGKTGINCFVLITGYFMCTSNISFRKILKLFGAFYMYTLIIFAIFAAFGYVELTPKFVIKSLVPFTTLDKNFISCYLVFFCFIPFLNILIKGMTKRQHQLLLLLSLVAFSVFPQLLVKVSLDYVWWFMVIYLIGSYFRLYPPQWSLNTKRMGLASLGFVVLSLISVVGGAQMGLILDKPIVYFFVNDSNKPLAVATAVCTFLFFKNLKIGYSKVINTIAASSFGVLLIHANSDTMRQWLWRDTLDNVGHYAENIYLHAFLSVFAVYAVCTLIDMLRIKFIEKPFFKWFDKLSER